MSPLHVQTRHRRDVPFNHLLRRLHLLIQLRIAHNPRRILHLPTCFVQPGNRPHNCSLQHVRQARDILEAHASRPLVHHFHEAKARTADKVVGVVCGLDDLQASLYVVDFFGDGDDGITAAFKVTCQGWFALGLLLEYEGGEQGGDFSGLEIREDIVQDELCEDEFVARVDFAGDFAFELDAGCVVDEAEFLEDLDALFVVGEELEVLVREGLFKVGDVFLDKPFIVTHGELFLGVSCGSLKGMR